MKTYIYDLEVYPNYFLAVLYDIETKEFSSYYLSKLFLNEVILNDQITLIGWNNHGYDDVILKWIQNQSLPVTTGFFKGSQTVITEQSIYELSNEIIQFGWDSSKIRELRWQDTLFKSIDVKAVLDPMPSLKKTEIRMRYKQVEDLPLPPGTILTDDEKQIVHQYCHNDVGATTEVYQKHAIPHIELREYLADRFTLNKEKLRSLSEAKTAEYILSEMACRRTSQRPWQIRKQLELEPVYEIELKKCIPNWIQFETKSLNDLLTKLKNTTLPIDLASGYADGTDIKQIVTVGNKNYKLGIGGLHSVDGPYRWTKENDDEELIDADVTSYYPSILLRDGLYPRGYTAAWIDAYAHIYDTRLTAKQNKEIIAAFAYKIVLNATFGKLGSIWSTFYDPQLLVRVTLTGQLGLLMLIEMFAEAELEVISANTDGVLVKRTSKNKYGVFTSCCKAWEVITKFNLEYTHYNAYARRDVNNYTALTTDNKIKNKGIFTPPDLQHDIQAAVIQKMARAYLLYGTELTDYLEENKDELTIYDFLFSFSANRDWKVYSRVKNDQIVVMQPIISKKTIKGQGEEALVSLINQNKQIKKENKELEKLTWDWTELSKSNRWYISSKPLDHHLVKTGGKLGNVISIPNGDHTVIKNEIKSNCIPKDLDYSYYIAAANKLIVSCEEI